MTKEQVYEIWRPADSPWTPWAKPVLFAFMDFAFPDDEETRNSPRLEHDWQIPFQPGIALIVNLPGEQGVSAGISLSRSGYRPVPIYNACPFATYALDAKVAVDASRIMSALHATSGALATANPLASAPPAFLVDANRNGYDIAPPPGWFDNRSFVTQNDFPSPAFLKERGISQIILIQANGKTGPDLTDLLLTFQAGGLGLAIQKAWAPWAPTPLLLQPPSVVARIWNRLRWRAGYRKDPFGYFGRLVLPQSG